MEGSSLRVALLLVSCLAVGLTVAKPSPEHGREKRQSDLQTCNQYYYFSFGRLHSSDCYIGSDGYPNGANFTYTIYAPYGCTEAYVGVYLEDVEPSSGCGYDSVEILNQSSPPFNEKLCGRDVTYSGIVYANPTDYSLTIAFSSDGSVQGTGFYVDYEFRCDSDYTTNSDYYNTGSNYNTGSYNNYNTGSYDNYNTGSYDNYNTGSYDNYNTGSYNNYNTGSYDNYNTGSYNNYNTGSYNNYNTGSYNNYNTGSYDNYNTGSYYNYNTGSYNNYNTGSYNNYNTDSNNPMASDSYYYQTTPSQGGNYVGHLLSPGYISSADSCHPGSDNYLDNSYCSYQIDTYTQEPGMCKAVTFDFYDVEIEECGQMCSCDNLQIPGYSPICGNSTGLIVTVEVPQFQSSLDVLFTTDGSVTRRGFSLSYYSFDVPCGTYPQQDQPYPATEPYPIPGPVFGTGMPIYTTSFPFNPTTSAGFEDQTRLVSSLMSVQSELRELQSEVAQVLQAAQDFLDILSNANVAAGK